MLKKVEKLLIGRRVSTAPAEGTKQVFLVKMLIVCAFAHEPLFSSLPSNELN